MARGLDVGAAVGKGRGFSHTGDLWWSDEAGGEWMALRKDCTERISE